MVGTYATRSDMRERVPGSWTARLARVANGNRKGTTLAAITTLSISLLSGGCVSTKAAYQAELDTLIGMGAAEIIRQFGPPVEADAESMYWERELSHESTTRGAEGGVTFGVTTSMTHYCRIRAFVEERRVARFEWRATRKALFGDEEVDEFHSGICSEFTSPRTSESWPEAEVWIGRTEGELVDAYGDVSPTIHDLEAGVRLLSWSDAQMSRSTAGVPQDPDPNVTRTGRTLRTCVVGYVVTEGVVSAVDSWGARRACPLPGEST